jgi:hypothetical protein
MTAKDQQELVLACFPGCDSHSLLVADLGIVNHGLADGNWKDQVFYLHALKRLMVSWKGEIPPILHVEKSQWPEWNTHNLEIAITIFYMKSFYSYFQHAPIVPHRLPHSASFMIHLQLPFRTHILISSTTFLFTSPEVQRTCLYNPTKHAKNVTLQDERQLGTRVQGLLISPQTSNQIRTASFNHTVSLPAIQPPPLSTPLPPHPYHHYSISTHHHAHAHILAGELSPVAANQPYCQNKAQMMIKHCLGLG